MERRRVEEMKEVERQRKLEAVLDMEEDMSRTVRRAQLTTVVGDSIHSNPSQEDRVTCTSNPPGPGHT